MKYLKRYKLFLENQSDVDTEINYEKEVVGEYPNTKVLGEHSIDEEDVDVEPSN